MAKKKVVMKRAKRDKLGADVFYRIRHSFEALQSFPWADVLEVMTPGREDIVKTVRDLDYDDEKHREILLALEAANERAVAFFEVWNRLWDIWEDGLFASLHGLKRKKK